jgi:hypothetical protein
MIFKILSPKKLATIFAFFAQTTASFCKNLIVTLVVEKNANFSPKIGKNRDHNIDQICTSKMSFAFYIHQRNYEKKIGRDVILTLCTMTSSAKNPKEWKWYQYT